MDAASPTPTTQPNSSEKPQGFCAFIPVVHHLFSWSELISMVQAVSLSEAYTWIRENLSHLNVKDEILLAMGLAFTFITGSCCYIFLFTLFTWRSFLSLINPSNKYFVPFMISLTLRLVFLWFSEFRTHYRDPLEDDQGPTKSCLNSFFSTGAIFID